ncbi:hypothetical protein [Paenibacillus sp. ACRRY]|uniref:rhamnogalacturonan lyase family protein n=1 Tax=Paenibacillus sp. ACRRY TaxID=2918208 RepID=UPI0023B80D25|nr:hypothetical protein [Paenibacillus sp. ACRRY]
MEYLDRGLIAIKTEDGVYLGWRMMGTDPDEVEFDLYRDGEKVNVEPIRTSTNYLDSSGTADAKYKLYIRNGVGPAGTEEVSVWGEQYLSIPLDKPEDGVLPNGEVHSYQANDASVGDLDGDGEYEIVLKWEAVARDSSSSGYTTNVYFDAYKLDGTKLWRIDAGRNIRSGAHYTQFLVYDFDGDGKAEVAFKTADGTIDGTGAVIGDPQADYRNSAGYILDGPEYLTIFNGETGQALDTVDYTPPRGTVSDWGDSYGNRVDRFLAGVAYLDGVHPSMVFTRGYYTRSVLAAYDFKEGKLVQRWVFDSKDPGNSSYEGQGNHSLGVADVDGDGFDEIAYGAATIDHDGTGLYSTGWGHGDALHVSDFDPLRPGLEIFKVYEPADSPRGFGVHDAETGESVWGVKTGGDTGRGIAADVDPRYPGAEMWASKSWDGTDGLSSLYSVQGEVISEKSPQSINFAVWWDGDLLRELFDHQFNFDTGYGLPKIDKWDWEAEQLEMIYAPSGVRTNNYTKGTPALQADIFGDWREEIILPSLDNNSLQIHTTTDLTEYGLYTLMHDPTYRLGVAWQNVAYNQPPHTGFYLGVGMDTPPEPSISLVGEPSSHHNKPITEAEVNGESHNGWYTSPVQVTFTMTNDNTGAGVTYYQINNSEIRTGTQLSLSNEGTHVVEYWSVGQDGSKESVQSLTVPIDLSPPTIEVQGQSHYTIDQQVDVRYTATDTGSGVAQMNGELLNKAAYTLEPGLNEVKITVSDLAGWEQSASHSFGVTATFKSLGGLTRTFAAGSEDSEAQQLTVQLISILQQAEGLAMAHEGEKAREKLNLYSTDIDAMKDVLFTSEQAEVLIRWSKWLTHETPLPNSAPGTPVLSDDNGFDTGLRDGDYMLSMDLWWGNNGTLFKLYENGELIDEVSLEDQTPSSQSVQTKITEKPDGTYVYTGELINALGITQSAPLTVTVKDALPNEAILSNDNWDGDGSYNVTMNMWWGTNANEYELYENGTLVDTQTLTVQTPDSQTAVTVITGRTPGIYEYEAILRNVAGVSRTEKMKVIVQ